MGRVHSPAEETFKKFYDSVVCPPMLYRYRAINDWLRSTIVDCTLHYASPLDFNDPFDSQFELGSDQSMRNLAKHFRETLPKWANVNRRERRQGAQRMKKDPGYEAMRLARTLRSAMSSAGVCCFSGAWNSLLQWAYYGDAHRGVVLGFDPRECPEHFNGLTPVRYVDAFPELNYFSEPLAAMMMLVTHKASVWQHEYEWRVVSTRNGPHSFFPKMLAEITFGVNCPAEQIELVKGWCRDASRHHIRFYKATRVKRAFAIERKPT
jgi:hypothetical protein